MADYRIGFRSLDTEFSGRELTVEGAVPHWLDGTLLRNGPGLFEVGGERVDHWFDGLAMIRRFAFDSGSVIFTNRFLRTEAYRETQTDGRMGTPQFATNPSSWWSMVRSLVVPSPTDNTNVNVMRVGPAFLGLTETPRYVAFDPDTLETDDEWEFDDDIRGHLSCAHPLVDPASGDTYNLLSTFGLGHEYRVTRLPAGETAREEVARVKTGDIAYMHSFALTERYVVLVEPPVVVDLATLFDPRVGSSFLDTLRWDPDRGSRFIVIDRESGTVRTEIEGPPFYFFHQSNGFERDGDIFLDMVTFEDASVLSALSLSALAAGEFEHPMGDLTRFRLSLSEGRVSRETIFDGHLSLPRVNESRLTEPYRYVYAQGARGTDRSDFPTGLRKIDVSTGDSVWWSNSSLYCAEPVFVPHPDREAEDAGVVLSVVLDTEAERSGLLVLDGETFTKQAIAWLPVVLPFDFHGQYYESARL